MAEGARLESVYTYCVSRVRIPPPPPNKEPRLSGGFYFAVGADFPIEILPSECGLVIADAYGASIIHDPKPHRLIAARRKAITLRFARLSANRLMQFTDPDWIRG